MFELLTHALFTKHLGTAFRIHCEETKPAEVKLIEANLLPMRAPQGGQPMRREPFSLLFRGPRNLQLPQRIYRIEHEQMGTFDLFIVPLGPDDKGFRYEAIFS